MCINTAGYLILFLKVNLDSFKFQGIINEVNERMNIYTGFELIS